MDSNITLNQFRGSGRAEKYKLRKKLTASDKNQEKI